MLQLSTTHAATQYNTCCNTVQHMLQHSTTHAATQYNTCCKPSQAYAALRICPLFFGFVLLDGGRDKHEISQRINLYSAEDLGHERSQACTIALSLATHITLLADELSLPQETVRMRHEADQGIPAGVS
jgi:replication-associated recombination protein RarA